MKPSQMSHYRVAAFDVLGCSSLRDPDDDLSLVGRTRRVRYTAAGFGHRGR